MTVFGFSERNSKVSQKTSWFPIAVTVLLRKSHAPSQPRDVGSKCSGAHRNGPCYRATTARQLCHAMSVRVLGSCVEPLVANSGIDCSPSIESRESVAHTMRSLLRLRRIKPQQTARAS